MNKRDKQIRRAVRTHQRTPKRYNLSQRPTPAFPPKSTAIGRASGAIGALSGTVPGTGNAVVYWATTLSSLVTSGSTEAVLNLGGEITDQTFFALKREPGTGKWFADSAQAPPSPTSPSASAGTTAEYFPAVARINSTPQVISGTTYTTIKFQDSLQTYPTGSSAITYSTTLDEFRVRDPGLYHISWNIPLNTNSPAISSGGWVQLQEDGTVVSGTQQDFETLGLPEPRACSIYHPITSSTKAYRMQTLGNGGVDGIIASGSTTGCARIDIRKVGLI